MIVHSMPATGVELDSELEREKAKYELNGRGRGEGARVSRVIDPPSPNCRESSSTGQERSGTGRVFQRLNGTKTVWRSPLIIRSLSNWCKMVQILRVPSTRSTLHTCPLLHCAICAHPFTSTFRFVPPQRPLLRRWYPSIQPRVGSHVSAADVNVSWWSSFIHQMTYSFCTVSIIYQRRL